MTRFGRMQRISLLAAFRRLSCLQVSCGQTTVPNRLHQTSPVCCMTALMPSCGEQRTNDPFALSMHDRSALMLIAEDALHMDCVNVCQMQHQSKHRSLPLPTHKRSRPSMPCSHIGHSSPLGEASLRVTDNCRIITRQTVYVGEHKPDICRLIADSMLPCTQHGLDVSSPSILVASDSGLGTASKVECSSKQSSAEPDKSHLPSQQTLDQTLAIITERMPRFFSDSNHRYNLYTKDIIFENNYFRQNKTTRGINAYAWELFKLRTKGNLAYVTVDMYIIKITAHPDDGTIRVRWTMKGVPQLEALMFWRWNVFNVKRKGGIKDKMRSTVKIHDGFNIFFVNKAGAIYRHKMDKVIPDEKKSEARSPVGHLLGQAATKQILGSPNPSVKSPG